MPIYSISDGTWHTISDDRNQEVVPWLKSAFAPLAELEDSYIKGKLYSPQTRQFTIPNIPGYMAEHGG